MPRILPIQPLQARPVLAQPQRVQPEYGHVGPNAAMDLALKGTALVGKLSEGADVLAQGIGGYRARSQFEDRRTVAQEALRRQQDAERQAVVGPEQQAMQEARTRGMGSLVGQAERSREADPEFAAMEQARLAARQMTAAQPQQVPAAALPAAALPAAPTSGPPPDAWQMQDQAAAQMPELLARLQSRPGSNPAIDPGAAQRISGRMAGISTRGLDIAPQQVAAAPQPAGAPGPAAEPVPQPEPVPEPGKGIGGAVTETMPSARQPATFDEHLAQAESFGVPLSYDELLGMAEGARAGTPEQRLKVMQLFDKAQGGGVGPKSWTDALTGEHLTRAKLALADRMAGKPAAEQSETKSMLDTLRAMEIGERVAERRGRRGETGAVNVAMPTAIGTSRYGAEEYGIKAGKSMREAAAGRHAEQKEAGVAQAAQGKGQLAGEEGRRAAAVVGGKIAQRAAQTALAREQKELTRAKTVTEWEQPELVREKIRDLKEKRGPLVAMWSRMPGSAFASSRVDYKPLMGKYLQDLEDQLKTAAEGAAAPEPLAGAAVKVGSMTQGQQMVKEQSQVQRAGQIVSPAQAKSINQQYQFLKKAMEDAGVDTSQLPQPPPMPDED